ncbi:Uncharacterized protein APZ42_027401 [Daphnia magna]|uniref:Uncharacterized protein n=1 Tax=Daphnia magna TaxID=35525 RepID=A0A164RJH9_9CRUS|nr:Uncharacterized protein APZ42_027401 [Daphnia magna]
MSSCVGPLNSTTGRKIHPESSRKHSWPFFFVHFFSFLSLYFFLRVMCSSSSSPPPRAEQLHQV